MFGVTDVPPERQCTLSRCERPALGSHPGALCAEHTPDEFEKSDRHEANDSPDSDPQGRAEGSFRDTKSDYERAESGSLSDVLGVETGVLPTLSAGPDAWMPWADWDHKQPTAEEYSSAENSLSYSDPANWAARETARDIAEWTRGLAGIGYVFQKSDDPYAEEADPYVAIDFDDARNPETEQMHPTAREIIERAGSYADVSWSWTGAHIIARGSLPDGVKTVDAELPGHSDFPDASIEVYDGKRFMAMTGRHIKGTPTDATDAQALIDDLADEYATVAEGTPDELVCEPEKSCDELVDVETTDDIQDVFDAIQHTDPRDIYLRSTVTHERGDRSKSLDPSWANSDSGTRLAQVGDGWVYRKGMRGLDALQVVALEERIITDEGEYPTGETFWRAVDALRERGTHIPDYEGPTGNGEPFVLLPNSPRARAAANGWDWMSADRGGVDDVLTIEDARERTKEAVLDAYESADRVLVETLPTMGKSYASIDADAKAGVPVSILTGRGNKEQYAQYEEWCEEHGLRAKFLPRTPRGTRLLYLVVYATLS